MRAQQRRVCVKSQRQEGEIFRRVFVRVLRRVKKLFNLQHVNGNVLCEKITRRNDAGKIANEKSRDEKSWKG